MSWTDWMNWSLVAMVPFVAVAVAVFVFKMTRLQRWVDSYYSPVHSTRRRGS